MVVPETDILPHQINSFRLLPHILPSVSKVVSYSLLMTLPCTWLPTGIMHKWDPAKNSLQQASDSSSNKHYAYSQCSARTGGSRRARVLAMQMLLEAVGSRKATLRGRKGIEVLARVRVGLLGCHRRDGSRTWLSTLRCKRPAATGLITMYEFYLILY